MAASANDTVFVGVPDIARITKRTRQRIAQVLEDQSRTKAVLPDADALINGYPFWLLDRLLPHLEKAGYPIASDVVAELRSKRAVPAGTVPVGVEEAVEILGSISPATLHSRLRINALAKPLFVLSRNNVWDMDELIVDARAHNFLVSEAAVAKWRARNGSGAPPRGEVELLVRVTLSVTGPDDDARARTANAYIHSALNPSDASGYDQGRVRVLDLTIQRSQQ